MTFLVRIERGAISTVKLLLLSALVTIPWVPVARADLIDYQEQATASGKLGSNNFTNALVTVTLIGDTSLRRGTTNDYFVPGTPMVTIAGLGTVTLTDTPAGNAYVDMHGPPTEMARCGIDATGGTVLGTDNAACGSYDLLSPIGPLTGAAAFLPSLTFHTDGGDLNISSVQGQTTFTATVIPEPSSISLLGISVAFLAGCNRLRRRLGDPRGTSASRPS